MASLVGCKYHLFPSAQDNFLILLILKTAAIPWTFAGVIALVVTVLVLGREGRRSAEFVFTHFESSSGWPVGWSFCVGLLHAAYATSSTGMVIS